MIVGGAIALLGLPLVGKLIPRNPVYGFRAAALVQSDKVWYKVNRVYGGGLVLSGATQFGLGALLDYLGSPTGPGFGLLTVLVLVLPLFGVYIWTLIYAHQTANRYYGRGKTQQQGAEQKDDLQEEQEETQEESDRDDSKQNDSDKDE